MQISIFFLVTFFLHVSKHPSANAAFSQKLCKSRCNDPYFPEDTCQCNQKCVKYVNCCPDYEENCLTCKGRCHDPYDRDFPCQCNTSCAHKMDCCHDYENICGEGGGSVSDHDLKEISEALLVSDVNNVAHLVAIDIQGKTVQCSPEDEASFGLMKSVDDSVFEVKTIAKLTKLFDNYNPDVKVPENVTQEDTKEVEEFMDAVFETSVMKATFDFLVKHQVFNGNLQELKNLMQQYWFDLYDRDGISSEHILGSSGFEHVFMGELKNGKVGGFHNWVKYAWEESKGNIDYRGYLSTEELGDKGIGCSVVFTWHGDMKCFGSFPVGTSPELDLAMYTICFMTRPGKKCRMSLNGQAVTIQTYEQHAEDKTYVGTAYPDWD